MSRNGGKRDKVERGIYRNARGEHYFIVTVNGKNYESPLWPADTAIAKLRTERRLFRLKKERELDREAQPTTTAIALAPKATAFAVNGSTMRDDLPQFLSTLAPGRRAKVKANFDRRWLPLFGDRDRDSIEAREITSALRGFTDDDTGKPLAPGTLKHYRQQLKQFYIAMNGKGGHNPVADVEAFMPAYDDPRGMPYQFIALILDEIDDVLWRAGDGRVGPPNETKVRLRVMATTGLNQAMLMRLERRDVNLKAGTMYVRGRQKGRGSKPRLLPLLDEAVAALRLFVECDLFGYFNTSSMAHTWRKALAKAKATWQATHDKDEPWPVSDTARVYDLRHSFACELYRRTGDLRMVAHFLGQVPGSQMVNRYIQAAIDDQAARAIARMRGRLLMKRVGAGSTIELGVTHPGRTAHRRIRASA